MKKRMTDVDKWEKPWFMDLTPAEKCLVLLVFDKCDPVGVFVPNFKLWSMIIGADVNSAMLKAINGGKQFLFFKDEKWWVPDFVFFQYGKLKPKSPVHQHYIKMLEKHGLPLDLVENPVEEIQEKTKGSQRVGQGLGKGCQTLQEEEEEKEKEKELKGGMGENINDPKIRTLVHESEISLIPLKSAREQMKLSQIWMETTMMKLGGRGFKLKQVQLENYIDKFIDHAANQLEGRRSSIRGYMSWFENWVMIELKDQKSGRNYKESQNAVIPYLKKG